MIILNRIIKPPAYIYICTTIFKKLIIYKANDANAFKKNLYNIIFEILIKINGKYKVAYFNLNNWIF